MRFPPGFDLTHLAVINANTVRFDLEVLDRDFDLAWLYAGKTVEGLKAVQLERLYHDPR
jgi:hypothetical protein